MAKPWCKWTDASGVTAEQQQQNVSHYFKGGTHIMHDHHSTFEIKGFYLYAVNTVSFTSFQWQHNGSRQRHGERQLCERKKYCSSSLQLPCTLLVTGFYCRFGQRKRRSVGEWLSTLQTERVSQGQATKRSVRQRGPRTPPQRSAAAVTLEFSPSNNSSLLWIISVRDLNKHIFKRGFASFRVTASRAKWKWGDWSEKLKLEVKWEV